MSRKTSKVCGDCPKWREGKGCCPFLAKVMVAAHPACRTGMRLIQNEYMRKYMANKRKDGAAK